MNAPAILIYPDGFTEAVQPADKGLWSLNELYRLLDCKMIQIVQVTNDLIMVVDEEAKLRRPVPPVNLEATVRCRVARAIFGDDCVVGRALFTSSASIE